MIEYHSKRYFGIFSGNNIIPCLQKVFDISVMVRNWKKCRILQRLSLKTLFHHKIKSTYKLSGINLTQKLAHVKLRSRKALIIVIVTTFYNNVYKNNVYNY